MTPELLFDPRKAGRPMRVAAFMSGSGTNIVKLLELERSRKAQHGASPYEVAFIYSDRSDGKCRGEAIACEAGIPYFSYDIRRFHELRDARRTMRTEEGRKLREEYDSVARVLVKTFGIDVIALGGYMSVTTLGRCVNVHPADLSITSEDGSRRFVGDDAVIDAIAAGQTELRASTLWTSAGEIGVSVGVVIGRAPSGQGKTCRRVGDARTHPYVIPRSYCDKSSRFNGLPRRAGRGDPLDPRFVEC